MEQTNKIFIGDVRDTISRLQDASIDCLNTSPPYFNLRNYAGNDKQIGREASGSDFIKSLANIIDAIKPKLKPTATMWINLGDTIDSGSQLLIPERFAIEMVDRGYKLVNQVIWYKPSCMPCSAKRRLGIDYEKVYLFALSDDYYFNMMKFPYKTATIKRAESFLKNDEASKTGSTKYMDEGIQDHRSILNNQFGKMPPIGGKKHQENGIATYSGDTPDYKDGANCRSVWTINPSRNREKHFATQAPEISRRVIAMGCPKGGLVCDPFHGLGTTMKAAVDAGCRYVGCELNEEYVRAGIKKWNIQGATIE